MKGESDIFVTHFNADFDVRFLGCHPDLDFPLDGGSLIDLKKGFIQRIYLMDFFNGGIEVFGSLERSGAEYSLPMWLYNQMY